MGDFAMPRLDTGLDTRPDTRVATNRAPAATRPVLSNCPECATELAVLRIIAGRGGAEYWTLRCTTCGSIHLDILKPAAESVAG